MRSSISSKFLQIPVIGYGLRVASNILRLPRTNDNFKKDLEEHQSHTQLLQQEQRDLKDQVAQAQAAINEKGERLEAIDRQLRLTDSRVADITHELSNLKVPHSKKKVAAPTAASSVESTLLADDHSLDQFYIEFENKFRGPEKDIKDRLKTYLPYFKEAKKTPNHPVLDIGCGRGEFLKLLKEHDVHAKGLDLNESMVKRAKEQGLDVIQADAMQYMHDLPSGSAYAVTGFHIVEHIPFATLLRLMDECYRAIQPGGYAIFETPNPENIIVGSLNFYHDPSHLNPIPPALLAFVMETRGFSDVQIKRLHPMEAEIEAEDPLVRRMAERMFGASDYAVVARK
jgi:SAM-dependent methyltransferase